jgi:hypothetical protein
MMRQEEIEIDLTNQVEDKLDKKSQSTFIDYSNKILAALEIKATKYNEQSKAKKTNTETLKKVYRNASSDYIQDESMTRSLWCLARVNLFLRLLSGEITDIQMKKTDSIEGHFDIASNLIPSEKDVELAKEDSKNYNLNFDFENVTDLYLDEYEKLTVDW